MTAPASVDLWEVDVPLHTPLVTAEGTWAVRNVVLIRLMDGQGNSGWGEAATFPGHTRDTTAEAWALLEAEGRRLLSGEEPVLIDGSAATAGLDAARAHLGAVVDGISLSQAIGGDGEPVPACAVIDLPPSRADLVGSVAHAAERGYESVKLKVDAATMGHVAAVRRSFPDLGIAVDANGSLGEMPPAAVADLDALALMYIEQPLAPADIEGLVAWRSMLATPICLDESIATLADIARCAEEGWGDVVSLKPGRLGPTLTLRGMAIARRHGLGAKIGGLVETGVGKQALVALATHPDATVPGDLAASDRFFAEDLVVPEWRLVDGCLDPAPHRRPDLSRIERRSKRHTRITV